MSTKDKLIERLKKQPKDFTWDELVRLFGIYGFSIDNKGKTSGSRTRFKNDNYIILSAQTPSFKCYKGKRIKQCIELSEKQWFHRLKLI